MPSAENLDLVLQSVQRRLQSIVEQYDRELVSADVCVDRVAAVESYVRALINGLSPKDEAYPSPLEPPEEAGVGSSGF